MRKILSVVALAAATALTMTACGGSDKGGTATEGGSAKVIVGASPVPHGEILKFIKDNLAKDAGLDLEIVEFNDYLEPNTALQDGSLDANYFQTVPYLDTQEVEFGYDFYPFAGVHIEPLGIYSDKFTDFNSIPDGAKIGVSNDPSNQSRGLKLLETAGFFTLKDTGEANATPDDIADNPHNVKVTAMDPQLLGKVLQDLDFAVINGNFALEADLKPSVDALKLEAGEDNPYANPLVVRTKDKDRPELVKLNDLLHSPEVKAFIEDTWTDGSVLPAF